MDLNQESGTINWDEYMRWQDTFLMKYTTELPKSPELVNQILQTYIEKTREQVHNIFRSPPHANIMAKKLAVIINFFHQSRENDKKIDMGEFLDSMSEAIAMYCDLRISALMMYKERIEDVQHAISTVLKMYLGNNHIHIVNALLRVKRHKFSRNLFEKLFTYIEEKAPFKECKSSPITYCRYLLFYRQWKKMYSDVTILKQLSTRGQANLKPPPNFRNHPLFDVLRPPGINVPPNMTLFFLTAPMNTNTAVEKFFQYLKSQNAFDQERNERQITPMEDVIEVIDLTDDPQIKRENVENKEQTNSSRDNSVNEVTLAFKRMTPVSSQSSNVPKRNMCNQQQSVHMEATSSSQSSFGEYMTETMSNTNNIFKSSQSSTSSMQFLEELSQTAKLPPWSTDRSPQDPRSSHRINETESTDTGIFSDRSVSDGCGNSPGYELEVKDFCTVNDIPSTIVIDDEDDAPRTESIKKSVSDQIVSPKSQSSTVSSVELNKSDECTIIETSDVVSIVIPEDTDDVQNEISDKTNSENLSQNQSTNNNTLCQNVTEIKLTASTSNSENQILKSSENSVNNSVKNISYSDSVVKPTEKSQSNVTTSPKHTNKSIIEDAATESTALDKTSHTNNENISNPLEDNVIEEMFESNDNIENNTTKDTVLSNEQSSSVQKCTESSDISISTNTLSPKRTLRDISVSTHELQSSSESNQISLTESSNNDGRKKSKVTVQSIGIGTDDELLLFTDMNKDKEITKTTNQEVKHLREIHSPHDSIDEEENEVNQMYAGPVNIHSSDLELLTSPQKEPDFYGFSNNRSSKHGSDHTMSNLNVSCSVHLQNITETTKESLKSKSQVRKSLSDKNSDHSQPYESSKDTHIKINVPKTILKTSSNKIRKSNKNKKSVVVSNEKFTRFIQDEEEEIDIEYDETVETKSGRKFAVNSTILSQSRKGGSFIISENHYDKPEDSEEETELEDNENHEKYQRRTTRQRSSSRDRDPYSRYSFYNYENSDSYSSSRRESNNASSRRSRSRRLSTSSEISNNSRYETRSRSRSRSIEPFKLETFNTPKKGARSREKSKDRTVAKYEELKRKFRILKEIQIILTREDLYKKKLEIDQAVAKKQQKEKLQKQTEQRRKRYNKRKKESISNTDESFNDVLHDPSEKSKRSPRKDRRGRPPRKKMEEIPTSPSANSTYPTSTYYSAPTRIPSLPEIVETLRLSGIKSDIKPMVSTDPEVATATEVPTIPTVPTIQNSIERLQNSLANSKILPSTEPKSNFEKKFFSIKSGNISKSTNLFEDNIVSSDLSIHSDSNSSDTLKSVQENKDFNEAVPLQTKNNHDEITNSKMDTDNINKASESSNFNSISIIDKTFENNTNGDIPMTNIPDSTVDDSSLNISTNQDMEIVDNKKSTKSSRKNNKSFDDNESSNKLSIISRPIRKCQSERKSGFFSKEAIRSHRIQFSNYYRNKARADFLHITGDSQLPSQSTVSASSSSSSSSSSSPKNSPVITETKDTTNKLSWEKFMALPENQQTEELLNKSDVIDQNLSKSLPSTNEIENVSGLEFNEHLEMHTSDKNSTKRQEIDQEQSLTFLSNRSIEKVKIENSKLTSSNKTLKGFKILKNELVTNKTNKEDPSISKSPNKDRSTNQEHSIQKNNEASSKQGTNSSLKTLKYDSLKFINSHNTDEKVHLKKEGKKLHSINTLDSLISNTGAIKIKRTLSVSALDDHTSKGDKIVKKKKYHPLPSLTKKQLKVENNFFSITEPPKDATNNRELPKRKLSIINMFENIDSEVNKSSNSNNPDSSFHLKRRKSLSTIPDFKKSPTPTTSQVSATVPKSIYVYETEDDISLAVIKQQFTRSIRIASENSENPNFDINSFYFKDGKLFNNENEIDICDISVVSWEEVVGEGTIIGSKSGSSFTLSNKLFSNMVGGSVVINKMKDKDKSKDYDSNKSIISPSKKIIFETKITEEKPDKTLFIFNQLGKS